MSDNEIRMLIEFICHGRKYLPDEVINWIGVDDIEALKSGEINIFNICSSLDGMESRGVDISINDDASFPAQT